MAGSTTLSRVQLVYGLCLPLAALIGFFLATPRSFTAMAIIGSLSALLAWPLFSRWYHPLLVFSLHSVFVLNFLPGQLPLWMFIVGAGFLLVVFRRCLDAELNFFPPGGVAWALLALAAVVVFTAVATGGIGLNVLGSQHMGGKKYVFVLLGIAAYFVLISRTVPRRQAMVYVALFCLSSLTSLISHLAYSAGDGFHWLFRFLDTAPAVGQAQADWDVQGNTMFRSTASMTAAGAVISFLLVRHGLKDLLDFKKPWRLALFGLCLAGGLLGGFRSFLASTAITLAVLFFLEGLHRTTYLALVLALVMVAFGSLACFSNRLPMSVQRAISFLPVPINPSAKQDAQGSLDWRYEIWRTVTPDVPKYLWLGKGYVIDPSIFQLTGFNSALGFAPRTEWAILAGEYHNGPLSVLIPFGLWGGLALGWFLVVAVRRLLRFCREGDPQLLGINRALCAFFITKIIFFLFLFGSLEGDLVEFVALSGLAECLNAGSPPAPAAVSTADAPGAFAAGEMEP